MVGADGLGEEGVCDRIELSHRPGNLEYEIDSKSLHRYSLKSKLVTGSIIAIKP